MWTVLALAASAASCVLRPAPDPSRFYVLAATVRDSPQPLGSMAVGLGPITMPGYLQHPMIATRMNGTQVRYADVDRWAEPLPALFGRALGQDLGTLLGIRVVPYPWYRSTPLDAVVRVDVSAFEVDAAGTARLDACWSIRDTQASTVRRQECSSITEAVDDSHTDAQVAALSRAVGELARRMASMIAS